MNEAYESSHLVGDVVRSIEEARASLCGITLAETMGPTLWRDYEALSDEPVA